MNTPVYVDYYSDILCVWAWIAQKRNDELHKKLGDKVKFNYHYMDLFGDTKGKMKKQWSDRGSFQGFAEHVKTSAAPFQDAYVNPKIWAQVRPVTSTNAHIVIKAVELALDQVTGNNIALAIRKAFFIDARDIGDLQVLLEICAEQGITKKLIQSKIDNGQAIAALMNDYQQAKEQALKGSPTYIIDNGRQTLYGNVGYKVLLANIENQLTKSSEDASWC